MGFPGETEETLDRTYRFLAATPPDLLEQASFDLKRLDEIAVDVRAHDALALLRSAVDRSPLPARVRGGHSP